MLFQIHGMGNSMPDNAFKGMQSAAGSTTPGYVRRLEMNLAKTLMISEALWELLRDKTGLTQDDLYKKLYQVDMRDGVLDGQNQAKVRNCPSCNRPVSGRHGAGLYCGHVIDESVFRME